VGYQEVDMRAAKLWAAATLCLVVASAFAENVEVKTERLAVVPIGDGIGQLVYNQDYEGLYGPSGPFVDSKGALYFIDTTTYARLQTFIDGQLKDLPFPEGWPEENYGLPAYEFQSQQGTTKSGMAVFSYDGKFCRNSLIKAIGLDKLEGLGDESIYPTPWGYFVEYRQRMKKDLFSIERMPFGNLVVRNLEETRTWLAKRNDAFSIGKDNLIYKGNAIWSAILPKELENYAYRYLGRLLSGHVIWIDGRRGMERSFKIATPAGRIELSFFIPWADDSAKRDYHLYTYGLGPWGELYTLIAPQGEQNEQWPTKDSTSELVAIRSYLTYFGRLNDSNVRLRKNPSTSADIIGIYPAKTGFRIIEKGKKQEIIGGKTDYWYHVRMLDGKEGWFFGSFVANLYDGPGTPPPWPNVADW
jgi:uncharacterized protein YgiM (DUF1202 family)